MDYKSHHVADAHLKRLCYGPCVPHVHYRWGRGKWECSVGHYQLPEGQSKSPTSWLTLYFRATGVTQQQAQPSLQAAENLGTTLRPPWSCTKRETKKNCVLISETEGLPKWFLPLHEFVTLLTGLMKVRWTFYDLVKTGYIIKRAHSSHEARKRACSRLKF